MHSRLLEACLLFAAEKSWRCYKSLNFVVDRDGLRVPIADGIGLELVGPDHEMEPFLRAIYRYRTGTFVDIGANVGHVLLTLARIDREIPYVAFEPLLRAACHVQRLIDANALHSTHAIYPLALGERSGTASLMTNSETDVSATITSVVRPHTMYRRRQAVCVSTGDVHLENVERIAAIKIDVEGSEVEVLSGLRNTLRVHRPVLIIEIMPTHHFEDGSYDRGYFGELKNAELQRLIANRKRRGAEIHDMLREIGYRFFMHRHGEFHPAAPGDSTLANQDFLVLPEEHVTKLSARS